MIPHIASERDRFTVKSLLERAMARIVRVKEK